MSIETATETAIQASIQASIQACSKTMPLGGRRHGRFPALIPWLLSVLLGVCLLVIGGCRASEPAANSDLLATTAPAGSLQEVSPPPAVQQLAAALAERSPQLQIEAPTADSVLAGGDWQLRLRLRDWPLVDAGPLGIGPHVVVQIDDQPPLRISDHRPSDQGDQLLLSLPPLAPGSHRITAYAALPWGEAVKDPGATARLRLHSVAANPLSLPAPGSPELIAVSPAELGGSEPLLLDWLLYDAPLQHLRQGDDSWRLRVSINGDSFLVDQNAPLWLRGWHQGSNALQFELVDGRGEPLNPPYNSLVRQVNLAGGPAPRWLAARLSSKELAVYLGQIPSETLASANRPAAPKIGAVGAGEPLAKQGASADQNDLPADAAKAGLAAAPNADTANAGAAKAETANADADAILTDSIGDEVDPVDFFDANTNANTNANTRASAGARANADQADLITANAIPPGESAPRASRSEPSQTRPHEAGDVNAVGNDAVDADSVDPDAGADIDVGVYAYMDVDAEVDAGADAVADVDTGADIDVASPVRVSAAPVAAAVAKPAIDQSQPQPQPQRSEPQQAQPQPQAQPKPQLSERRQFQPESALSEPVSGQATPSQINPAVAEPEFSQPSFSEPALTKSALADRLIGRLLGRDRPTAQEQPQGDADQAASDPAPGGGPLGGLRRRLAR